MLIVIAKEPGEFDQAKARLDEYGPPQWGSSVL